MMILIVWMLIMKTGAPNEVLLRQALRRIFPDEEILFKARKVLNIKQTDGTGSYLEVDASIPRLKFHVEYQDPYHYTTSIHYSNRPLAEIQATDTFKKKYLSERGESLLQLPCWWDGTDESLVATIKSMRPDLLQHCNPSCPPVPETEPHNFLQYDVVPDAGPLMRPIFFAKKYYEQGGIWLGNEKLDGVRCCWNPKKRKLYSRRGNELRFPEEFKQHMPNAFLDGEVWFGRGQYNEAAKLSKLRTSAVNWPLFRISAFDLAGTNSTQMTYGERFSTLHSIIPNNHTILFIPSVIQINSEEQRINFERIIANIGGEGIILTEKNSPYVHGQTSKVLKVKPSLDKEALVVASDSEYLTLQLTDGTRFRTRIPNIQPSPRVRDVITLTYTRCIQGSTLPEKPQIHRVRSDVTWSEVVSFANAGVPFSKRGLGRDYAMRWDRSLDDLKGYFTKFAQDNNFDPLVPANWYNVHIPDIMALPGAANMLKSFGGVINAIIASFPNIGIDKSMFSTVPKGYWENMNNIRKWFDQLAKQKGFDPLIAQNWYTVTRADVLDTKGGHSVIHHFNKSHINALVAAYPDVGIHKSMFSTVPKRHWRDIDNVRKWFNEFAQQKGFDPLIAQNWYTVTRSDVLDTKGGHSITNCFNKSHINSLVAAYPDIGIDRSLFSTVPRGYWEDINNVRKWFDQFAKQKGFNPLIAENWYTVTRADVMGTKGGHSILDPFNTSHINALVSAYPEIGIDRSMFSKVPQRHWRDINNVRKWFDEFAKRKGFDPLIAKNWYNVTRSDILDMKGGSIIDPFNTSHIKALVAAYPDIGFDKSMFSTVPRSYWENIENVKKWFDEFAQQKGFDPLIAQNWYTVTRSDVLDTKGGYSVINRFSTSHINALVAAYPDIGIDKSMFSKVPQRHWRDINNVRKWFDEFAKQNGFDPLISQNWYTISRGALYNKKGATGMLKRYNRSYINAVVAAYPDIGINKSMFPVLRGH